MVELIASDFYVYYRPSKCELRVYLRHLGEEEAGPSPYEQVLLRLGARHEQAHLRTFSDVVDLSWGPLEWRARRTRGEVEKRAPVLYQPVLTALTSLNSTECRVTGTPDFLILDGDRYAIRDSKISRQITPSAHPEILRQLQIYGWLYERTFGGPPSRLEVHSGTGEIVEVPFDGGTAALRLLGKILTLRQSGTEPYSAVGWTKCGRCGFHDRCWPRAEARRDLALVSGIDQALAAALHQEGIDTLDDLLNHFDEAGLAAFRYPLNGKRRRVGRRATRIMRMARSLASGAEMLLRVPDLPEHDQYVMFDVEGLPPQLDELDKVYLWGLQVYGEKPGEFLPALADFGANGDRKGWEDFLGNAATILDSDGEIPFVHWHHYERARLKAYVARFGDRDGVAARVEANLLDLCSVTKQSVVLPLSSYSLKVIESYVGFERERRDYGGDWAMAAYIEATETDDHARRDELIGKILEYNREDLAATWAVLQWLKEKRATL